MGKNTVLLMLVIILLTQLSAHETTRKLSAQSQLLKSVLTEILDEAMARDNSTFICIKAIWNIFTNKKEFVQYFDALGKPGSGLFHGDRFMMGSFGLCPEDAHYCIMTNMKSSLLSTDGKNMTKIVFGTCMPKECNPRNFTFLAKIASGIIHNVMGKEYFRVIEYSEDSDCKQKLGFDDGYCYAKKKIYSAGNISMIVVSSIFLLSVIFGSLVHLYLYFRNENFNCVKQTKFVQFWMCFSLAENTKALFRTDKLPEDTIRSLHGLRVLTMNWIILGQVLQYSIAYLRDEKLIKQWISRFAMQAVLNVSLALDTFFFISGLLTTYRFYIKRKRRKLAGQDVRLTNKKAYIWALLKCYFHRYFRLTPLYAYVILFSIYLLPLLGDGPLWVGIDPPGGWSKNACPKKIWTNLLYINNFYPMEPIKRCFETGWFLSSNMQFFVLAPFVLFLFRNLNYIWKMIVVGIATLMYLLTNALLIHYKKVDVLSYTEKDIFTIEKSNYASHIYQTFLRRMAPYFYGMLFGYQLYDCSRSDDERPEYRRPKKETEMERFIKGFVIWLLIIILVSIAVYIPFINVVVPWRDIDHILYGTLSPLVWTLAIGLLVYVCQNNMAGKINAILSWEAFIPLSRLTFATYLVHIMLVKMYFASLRKPIYMTEIVFVYLYVGLVILSFGVAYFFVVLIEYPIRNVIQYVKECRTVPVHPVQEGSGNQS